MEIGVRTALTTLSFVVLTIPISWSADASAADTPPSADTSEYVEAEGPNRFPLTLQGDEPGLTDELQKRYAGQHPSGQYRAYFDTDGRVRRVEVVQSIAGLDAAVIARIQATKYAAPKERIKVVLPVELTLLQPDRPMPPAPASAEPPTRDDRSAPDSGLLIALRGREAGLTEQLRAQYADQRPRGTYRVHVEKNGSCPRVDVLSSISGADELVVAQLRAMRWKPQSQPVQLIVPVVLALPYPLQEPRSAGGIVATNERPKKVPPHALDSQVLEHHWPRLPDAVKRDAAGKQLAGIYKVCLGRHGRVTGVDVVMSIPGGDDTVIASLFGWKYKPQPIPVCSMMDFIFTVN